ncbi:MAG: GMC family oxidoreductase [Acidobacteriaceae bacterium]|nr:GMC family oxidoreductase [Acidobacteriaceae bacterium]MBV9036533.1 GMC family oxidoreductase [Acidobacteriaceae bacterium]
MAMKEYEVLIVGSGHSGGMAANILTQKGISCLMLNAGPEADFGRDRTLKSAHELPYRGFNQPGRLPHVFQATEFNANQWVDEKEVPYTHPPDAEYNWVRVRLLGGRSLFWARQSFRLSNFEFKAADIDGTGENWPISLDDLAPFYSRVETIFRVTGRKEGWPQFPDGNFVETTFPADTETIKRVTELANKRGIQVSKWRHAQGQNGLASSINLLLPDALATGKLDMVENAIVREISVDKNTGLANGAHFVDRHSGREMHVKAHAVVLAAGCLESTRLLLNSGIANSSGVMGHYLVDQMYGVSVVASVPEARDGKAKPGLMGGSAFIPRFRNLTKNDKRDFIKGYCVNISSGGSASPNFFPLYGAELQEKLDSYAGSCVSGGIFGERVARYENHVRINKDVKDAWGIPVLHIEARDSENERNLRRDAANTIEELFHEAGWEIICKTDQVNPPGYSIHEVGTCRMGNDPKKSVLNKWCQSHDIKNLFVVDGASFVTAGWQNPTMTILALSMRASEHLAEEMNQRNI